MSGLSSVFLKVVDSSRHNQLLQNAVATAVAGAVALFILTRSPMSKHQMRCVTSKVVQKMSIPVSAHRPYINRAHAVLQDIPERQLTGKVSHSRHTSESLAKVPLLPDLLAIVAVVAAPAVWLLCSSNRHEIQSAPYSMLSTTGDSFQGPKGPRSSKKKNKKRSEPRKTSDLEEPPLLSEMPFDVRISEVMKIWKEAEREIGSQADFLDDMANSDESLQCSDSISGAMEVAKVAFETLDLQKEIEAMREEIEALKKENEFLKRESSADRQGVESLETDLSANPMEFVANKNEIVVEGSQQSGSVQEDMFRLCKEHLLRLGRTGEVNVKRIVDLFLLCSCMWKYPDPKKLQKIMDDNYYEDDCDLPLQLAKVKSRLKQEKVDNVVRAYYELDSKDKSRMSFPELWALIFKVMKDDPKKQWPKLLKALLIEWLEQPCDGAPQPHE